MPQVIALWSHPRSMSTATERIMRERGDLHCFHEPFMYYYYVHRQVRTLPHFDIKDDHPTTFADIRNMLLRQADKGPVFFKDMSYYVMPDALKDETFMRQLTHCFLIRNPMSSIASYYKLDPDLTCEEIGLEAQWAHFCGLRDMGLSPVVVEAETIREDAEAVIGALWRAIGLPHSATAFDWRSSPPDDWQQVSDWHGDVSSSSAILPISETERAEHKARFDKLCAQAPHLGKYLDHHQPFYENLRAQVLRGRD